MKVTVIPTVIVTLGTVTKGLIIRSGKIGDKSTSGDHLNYSTVKISQYTGKSPGDLRRLAVTQLQ